MQIPNLKARPLPLIKITIEAHLHLDYLKDRKLLQGILDTYHAICVSTEPVVPDDLDIASGEPNFPPVVTVYTSEGNEELAKSHLNVNDTVGRVDVRLADEGADKKKRTRKTRNDKGKPRTSKSKEDPNPIKEILKICVLTSVAKSKTPLITYKLPS